MINLILQRLKDQYRGALFYLAGLVLYAWTMIAMFPTIQKNMNLDEYIKQMPEQFIKLVSGGETLSYSKIEGFLSMEYLSLFFVLIIVFYIAASAGSAIAGAIEKHQMDFTLSQPISRTKLVLSETIVGVVYTVGMIMLTSISIWLLCKVYNVNISVNGLAAFGLVASIFMTAIYGISIFLSSVMKSKMAVTGATAGIVMGFYILTSLTNIVDKISGLKNYSLFALYKPQTLLETGNINWHQVEILVAIFAVGLVSSIIIFNKRDI
jgi:ABC-2 type transport system permease protein